MSGTFFESLTPTEPYAPDPTAYPVLSKLMGVFWALRPWRRRLS